MTAQMVRPISVLAAAMGGEGGGVLANWIVNAATAEGLPVQSTSIPGVAQRTGATTYYLEILPVPAASLGGGVRPVFSLVPQVGDVDLVAASELLEAGRAIANGFTAPDRTTIVASTSRVYAMAEKTAMGDGRLDPARLTQVIGQETRRALLFDMAAAAREAGCPVNAVLLGAIAGAGILPIADQAFEAAIRSEAKATEANLRGFRAGLARARQNAAPAAPAEPGKRRARAVAAAAALEARARAELAEAAEHAVEGVRRLAGYQDAAYAALYLDRLGRIAAVERSLGGTGALSRAVARHLALRMSYEDVIRVAQLKADPERLGRIVREIGAAPGQPVAVVDFFKPGVDELCSILPPALARPILGWAERTGRRDRLYWGMTLRATTIAGYARLRLLAALRRYRRRTYRFIEEQRAIEAWLAAIVAAARIALPLGLEVAECARLIKGYGDTHRRGLANWQRIEHAIVAPALAGSMPAATAADAIASARVAALRDPEGDALGRTLEAIRARLTRPLAAADPA